MEFTEKEIERFGKAKELQEEWVPKRGDWFYKADGLGQGTWLICTIAGNTLWCAGEGMNTPIFKNRLVEFRNPANYTWIPSLENLLEMVIKTETDAQDIGRILVDFKVGEKMTGISEFGSRLKLSLLGILMCKRYGQKWDGKTWKKQSQPEKKPPKSKK